MAAAAAASTSIFTSSPHSFPANPRIESPSSPSPSVPVNRFKGGASSLGRSSFPEAKFARYTLPSWAMFELGRAPVYWKTVNGLPPTSFRQGERLKLFYNPATTQLKPNEEFGIGFNGGFNQPIMCGGEPRAMLRKDRGKADKPIYTIQICIPKHAVNLIFSFTNGVDWDGPYSLQFQVPKNLRNKPIEFLNEGLAEELSKEGACERAIFPDTSVVITRCTMIGNLTVEGDDRYDLNLVPGCMDPNSSYYNPLANVDDGSCPPCSTRRVKINKPFSCQNVVMSVYNCQNVGVHRNHRSVNKLCLSV
ncbi:hypothetical protein MLD38_030665 [Melastoma candidum]|uniref:Uncharacterized protein n=1 Tax=Melastoma candidum TaxID=119954 RepID=A0ACB9MME8_9MYRT|nr:hypothetical protein MLD38_030665 [Melastoma candidum]